MKSEEAWSVRKCRIFGEPRMREAVMEQIRADEGVYGRFLELNEQLQEDFVSFCMGVKGLNITYDSVFKMVFNPELHPERLEDFISQCIKKKVRILEIVPNESNRLTQDGSLLVMDIVVRTEVGEVVNVEIQRVGYLFPGARCACYSSDLVMRQYAKVRDEKRKARERFSYQDIKTVYTIVLIQQSTKEFWKLPDTHLHYAKQIFDTGLELNMLQEYLIIPLDIMMKNHHNISNRLDAWLYFIASDDPEDICRVTEAYPEFEDIYRQVFEFRYCMKELMNMFSDALRILDRNTVQYMIKLQKEEIEQLRAENQRQAEENQRQVEENQRQAQESRSQIENLRKEIERLKADLKAED